MEEIDIQKWISSTMDSVVLIEQLKTKVDITDEDLSIIERNVSHLRLMKQSDLFVNLQAEQVNRIELILNS